LPGWLTSYDKSLLLDDAAAGLTVAVMLIPQGMAYAMLAGLSPVTGLYAATFPLIGYAFFGSCRQLAVGPVAMLSLLVFAACSRIATPGSAEYAGAVLVLAVLVGAFQLAAGLLRLGFIVNFVSHAVIRGFTSAAAIVIGLSQLKHVLGIRLGNEHSVFKVIREIVVNLDQTNLATLAIGLTSIVVLYLLKWKRPRLPGAMVCVAAGTLAVYWFELSRLGVATVGEVPKGLPSLTLAAPDWELFRALGPAAFAIFLVGYMESISIAKYVAARSGYEIRPNRELIGLGVANLTAGFFGGYPVTGGFSRTAVNHQAGARTQLAGLITAAAVMLTLLVFTPLFYHLPNAVLGAIVLVAVSGLVDYREAIRLFRIKAGDGWTFVVTFAATLSVGIEAGIIAGVASSLGLFLWRSAHPHTAELGYLPDERVFRNLKRYPEARCFSGVLILRVDASLYFANARFLNDWVDHFIAVRDKVQWVVIDMSGVNDIDALGLEVLEHMAEIHGHRGIRFAFAAVKGPVRDLADRAGWRERYGDGWARPSIELVLKDIGVWDVAMGG